MSDEPKNQPKDQKIMVRLDAETMQRLEAEALRQRRKVADLARIYIEDGLDKEFNKLNRCSV